MNKIPVEMYIEEGSLGWYLVVKVGDSIERTTVSYTLAQPTADKVVDALADLSHMRDMVDNLYDTVYDRD